MENALALGIKPLQLDVATPLMQAAKIKQANMEMEAQQLQVQREAAGQFARGVAVYADKPEFASKWAEGLDDLHARGLMPTAAYQRLRDNPSPLVLQSIIAQTEKPELALQRQQFEETKRHAGVMEKQGQQRIDIERDTKNLAPGFVRTPEGGQKFVPGGPADPAYIAQTVEAKDKTTEQIAEREKAVKDRGLDPKDPQNRAYILTGKMPREDQQPLTATDKKAILEADELVLSNQTTIDALKDAKELSKKAYEGATAGARGFVTKQFGAESGVATAELHNVIVGNALGQLKSIFGAAPTEGERKILLELQGSVNEPDAVRQKIFDRAIVLAEKRLAFNKQRAAELRGGTFYKSGDAKAKPILDEARKAIDAGADREAVIKRLRDNGIDPAGL